jgi:LysM repeat protein
MLLLAAAFVVACGGGSDGSGSLDLSEVPTATLPDPLPEAVIVGETSGPTGGATYTVAAGDSLAAIADRFGTTVEAIVEANDIADPTRLAVGQVLAIPGASEGEGEVLGATEEPPATATPEPPERPEGEVYVVQAGDIPETIAAQFGITAEELMAANGITDPTSLQIGQEMVIPTPRPTPAEE